MSRMVQPVLSPPPFHTEMDSSSSHCGRSRHPLSASSISVSLVRELSETFRARLRQSPEIFGTTRRTSGTPGEFRRTSRKSHDFLIQKKRSGQTRAKIPSIIREIGAFGVVFSWFYKVYVVFFQVTSRSLTLFPLLPLCIDFPINSTNSRHFGGLEFFLS